MVTNNIKWVAQTIAPNPKEIDYWIDLSEDTNGGIIKFWNGQTWDYLNKMDDQDRDIAEEVARAKAAEQQLQSNIDSEEAARIQADNQLRQSINQEIIDRQNADTELQNDINNKADKTVASTSSNGLMSSADKQNLDNLVSNTAGYQTESQVDAKIAALVDSAPETLDTLNELAAALGDDPSFITTITNQIANKADNTLATTSTNGLMSSTDKQKLDSVETDANHYVLPGATSDVLGGVKQATTVADTTIDGTETATTVATTLNSLLAALRTAGILAS